MFLRVTYFGFLVLIYYLFGYLSLILLASGFFYRASLVLSFSVFCAHSTLMLSALGCNGNDVIYRYLPWIDSLVGNYNATSYWGSLEFVPGSIIFAVAQFFPDSSSCFYLSFSRIFSFVVFPPLIPLILGRPSLLRHTLTLMSSCLIFVQFVLAFSNTILQGFSLFFSYYFCRCYLFFVTSSRLSVLGFSLPI